MKDITPVNGALDFSNPRALVNMVPTYIRQRIIEMPLQFLEMNEYDLEKLVRVSPFVNRVRNAFWQEYEKAQREIRRINMQNIVVYLGSLEVHIRSLFKDDLTAAWILCPPTSYSIFLDEALDYGLKRLRDDILTLPVKDPDTGELDPKSADLLLKAVAFLDMRKHGSVVQKTMNLNVNTTKSDIREVGDAMSLLDIDKKIKELEVKQDHANRQRLAEPEITEIEDVGEGD